MQMVLINDYCKSFTLINTLLFFTTATPFTGKKINHVI